MAGGITLNALLSGEEVCYCLDYYSSKELTPVEDTYFYSKQKQGPHIARLELANKLSTDSRLFARQEKSLVVVSDEIFLSDAHYAFTKKTIPPVTNAIYHVQLEPERTGLFPRDFSIRKAELLSVNQEY